MDVNYVAPLRRSWERMKRQLFSPFELERWLIIGFAAFLESVAGLPFAGSGGNWHMKNDRMPDSPAVQQAVTRVVEFLSKPVWLLVIALALIAFAVIYGVLLWVSARGHFVFLECVVTGRSEFRTPWSRNSSLGTSLFLFWAALSFAWLVPIAFALAGLAPILKVWLATHTFVLPPPAVLVVSGAGALLGSLAIMVASLLTHDFVIPIMWRQREGATRAWARFWPLLTAHAGDFAAYLLFVVLVVVLVSLAVLIAGFASCCIGFLLLAIPYVGTVALLPLLVTARVFPAEFLAQYGPDWNVFPAEEQAPPGSAAPAGQ